MQNKKPTIITISKSTGYSTGTVSRVLNGYGNKYRISIETQKKILAKAKEINYQPNQIAKGLRLNKTFTIGLIIPDISNPFFSEIAQIITREAKQHNQTILLLDSEENEDHEQECIAVLLARNVDGILLFPTSNKSKYVEQISNIATPIVLVDRHFNSSNIPYVVSDNFQGAYDATKHLIDNGHKHIFCIQGNVKSSANIERLKGYKKAITDSGLSDTHFHIGGDSFTIANGYSETKKIVSAKIKFTAIFTLSNLIAIGAIQALKEKNISIPNDISLITFDDNIFLTITTPPITTIDQPKKDIGKNAISLLISLINKEKIKSTKIKLKTMLNKRESVKKIN